MRTVRLVLFPLCFISWVYAGSAQPEEVSIIIIKEARSVLMTGGFGTRVLVEGNTTTVRFLNSSSRGKQLPILLTYILEDDTGEIEILANPSMPPPKGGRLRVRISPTATASSYGKVAGLPAFEMERISEGQVEE
jgi:hypothetical protein